MVAGVDVGPQAPAHAPAPEGESPPAELAIGNLCAGSIKDRAGGNACLEASSIPTFGLLLPYPGMNNVFAAPAFVGGGQNNMASDDMATVGGGRNRELSGVNRRCDSALP